MVKTSLHEMRQNIAPINNLPDDCLAHIFSFLSISNKLIIERVCKRWHGVSAKGWHRTSEINLPGEFSKEQVHAILKRCGRFVTKLNIRIGNECIECLPMIFKFCQLKRLEDCHITYYLPHDKTKLNNMNSTRYCVPQGKSKRNSENLMKLFEESTEWRSIKIEGMLNYYHEEFSNLLALGNLKKLEITNNWGDVSRSSDRLLLEIKLLECPNLNELSFYGVTLMVEDEKNHKCCQNPMAGLETLTMHNCEGSEEFFKNLKFFTNLKTLDLSDAHGLKKEDVSGMAKNCQNLMTLSLFGYDWIESCFEDLGTMPSLKTLVLNPFRSTPDGTSIKYLTNVKHLEIYSLFTLIKSCNGLLHLITHSVNLQNLNFNIGTGDECLRAEIANIFVQGLRSIPLHLTIRVRALRCGHPPYTYDGPEHPLFKVTYVEFSFCSDD